jgi:protein-tyrosine phosphatase
MSRPTRLDQLTRFGVTALLSVNHRVPPDDVLADFQKLGLWSHIALPDGKKPDEEGLQIAVRQVQFFLEAGYRTAVHCDAGRNRACLVAALVIRERYCYSGAQAASWVRSRRPNALANQAQYEWLVSLPAPTLFLNGQT